MYIRKTLEVLREHKLYIRMTKWLLSNKEDYLGHNIGINGVKPDPSKMVFKQPKTRALWRFLGVQGLSPKVIQDFMMIVTPLMNLTQKKTPYKWTSQEEAALNELKTKLTEAPVLKTADPSREYMVTCDGSDTAVGAVFSQVYESGDHFVGLESRKMNTAEVNYRPMKKSSW